MKLEIINAETFHSLLCTMTQAMTFQEDNGAVMKKKKSQIFPMKYGPNWLPGGDMY